MSSRNHFGYILDESMRSDYHNSSALVHLAQELVRRFFWQLALKKAIGRKVGRIARPRESTVSVVSLTGEENI